MLSDFIEKQIEVSKKRIFDRSFSFSPKDLRSINILNNNVQNIGNLINEHIAGEQIDVNDYIHFKTLYKLITISCMSDLEVNPNDGENISPITFNNSSKKLIPNDMLISRNASLGKISFIPTDIKDNCILNGGISCLRFDDEKIKNYISAFFVSSYGKLYLETITSNGGTQQNSKSGDLLNMKIPFPTLNNHQNPNNIIELVSILAQNLIDKENQILKKNKEIDAEFIKELGIGNHGQVEASKSIFMKTNFRFAASVYKKEYVDIIESVKNYKFGSFNITNGDITCGNTPPDYYFSDKANNLWITSKTIERRVLTGIRKVHSNKKPNLKDLDVIIMSIGSGLGTKYRGMLYRDTFGPAFVNQNCYKINKGNLTDNIFILAYLTSESVMPIIKNMLNKGSVPAIYSNNIMDMPIPNFPSQIKQKIHQIYYNDVNVSINSIGTYLNNEMARNNKLGIWQLGIECFNLRNKLENLIELVIFNKNIEINDFLN